MSWISTPSMGLLERFLDLAVVRHGLIASNMANIDTPQYRTVDIDFQAELRKAVSRMTARTPAPALQEVPGLVELINSDRANIEPPQYRTVDFDYQAEFRKAVPQMTSQTAAPAVREVSGLIERPDGNNVSLERETMLLAETQMKFQFATQLLRSEFHRLLSAINEGK